jgi:hypothetical protein
MQPANDNAAARTRRDHRFSQLAHKVHPMIGTILLIVVLLLLLGVLPVYPHSRNWGYYPSGGLGLILIILLILVLLRVF